MKRSRYLFFLVFLSMSIFVASEKPLLAEPAPLPAGTLSGNAVIQLFSDRTVESVLVRKGRVSLTYYNPDGSLEQLQGGKKRLGSWRVNKNARICLQFDGSREKCRIIVKEGKIFKKYIVKKNGQHQYIVKYRNFLPGNQL